MYKYCSFSEHSITNLLNNKLHMNHYESFNDPFECRCEILEGFPDKDPNSSRFRNILNAWGFDDAHDPCAIENYEDLVLSLEGTEPNVPLTLETARISCFSKTPDNLLMWSHYADGLRGFCIEFDRDLLLSNCSDTAGIFEVSYEDKPPIVDTAVIAVLNDQTDYHHEAISALHSEMNFFGKDNKPEINAYEEYLKDVFIKGTELFQKMLATKPIEWRYEEELRIISQPKNQDKPDEFLNYPPEAIKCVIIGERMPMQQQQALKQILERHPSSVKLKDASRAKSEFNVMVSDARIVI